MLIACVEIGQWMDFQDIIYTLFGIKNIIKLTKNEAGFERIALK